MRALLAFALVGVLGQVSGGCGGERTPLEPEDVFGTFSLKSIGGEKLPVTGSQVTTFTPTTVSGTLKLNPDFTFERVTATTRRWNDGSVTGPYLYDEEGTWEILGVQKLSLHSTNTYDFTYDGRAEKNRVEVWLIFESQKFVYTR